MKSATLTRLELALVLMVFAVGVGLRAAYPSRMAVEHFDEGVYASNLYTPEGRYPFQHLYAPPLLPFCLEWAAIFGGPDAVVWVNVVSGSLTLLVLWGMVRQWWGPSAAIAAMVLLAFNEFHIAYSRAALTDAMLGLWMTAGVWAGWRAIQFGGARNIAAAGVLASLAWWTKYNGWLTLAVTGAGTAGWILFGGARTIAAGVGDQSPEAVGSQSRPGKRAKSSAGSRPPLAEAPKTGTVFGAGRLYLGRWALTAAIAFLLWSPWLWELQQYGGYSAVAKNHAGYFTGLGAWWGNAVRQCSAQWHYHGHLFWLGFIVAPLVAVAWATWLFPVGPTPRPRRMVEMLRRAPDLLSAWMISAWIVGLGVAVPMYAPYPRLSLPLEIATCVVVGLIGKAASADVVFEHDSNSTVTAGIAAQRRQLWWGLPIALIVGFSFVTGQSRAGAIPQWESRTELGTISASIVSQLQKEPLTAEVDGVRCIVSVVAEPGLFFHLAAAQRGSAISHVTLPAADFGIAKPGANTSGLPVYVVVGPHADQAEADRLIAHGRLEPVGEFEYRPSDLVLLDGRPAWDLPPRDNPVVERIRLLHVKP